MIQRILTPQKAYSILKEHFPGKVAKGCVEFPTFYTFYMVARELKNEALISSQYVDAVDKKTGQIFEYDIFSDMKAYQGAKNVDVRKLR